MYGQQQYPEPMPIAPVPTQYNSLPPAHDNEYEEFLRWKASRSPQPAFYPQDQYAPSIQRPPPFQTDMPAPPQYPPYQYPPPPPLPFAPSQGFQYGGTSFSTTARLGQPMRLTQDSVCDAATGQQFLLVTNPESKGILSSGKQKLLIRRVMTGAPMGTVRFRSLEDIIEMTINGRENKLEKVYSSSDLSSSWRWEPAVSMRFPQGMSDARWHWTSEGDDLVLADAKKTKRLPGNVIARVTGDVLIFEDHERRLYSPELVDEIVVTALAVMVKLKKIREDNKAAGEVVLEMVASGAGL